jgi:hypothetical protein
MSIKFAKRTPTKHRGQQHVAENPMRRNAFGDCTLRAVGMLVPLLLSHRARLLHAA